MSEFDVIVVGAGPAGIIAAGRAAMSGAKVLLLEKMEKPARKLRISGKGSCNITSTKPYNEFISEISENARFLNTAFGTFFSSHIVELLNDMGVQTIVERGQRVFPASKNAHHVADALVNWAKRQGASVKVGALVEEVVVRDGAVDAVRVNGETIATRSVIVATGGKSYPATGSTGDGYKFAMQLGHSVTPLFPSLVGIEVSQPFARAAGLTLKNVRAELVVNGAVVAEEFGEVLLTAFGLEGASVLRLSRQAIRHFSCGQRVHISIDLKPALSHEKLFNRIVRDLEANAGIDVGGLLRGLMPQAMVSYVGRLLGLSTTRKVAHLSDDEISQMVDTLKSLEFSMCGFRPWTEAIVTSGGVATAEIDPRTMQSKLVHGLYFAGEVIDVDANTGGFNLQIAYSTGWLAGQSATEP